MFNSNYNKLLQHLTVDHYLLSCCWQWTLAAVICSVYFPVEDNSQCRLSHLCQTCGLCFLKVDLCFVLYPNYILKQRIFHHAQANVQSPL